MSEALLKAIAGRRWKRTLRDVFGLTALRAGQRQVIERVLAGGSTLAVMPTGAGKSLCYQLPAALLRGRTVVISPLIALMKDQCEKLHALGIQAVQFNSHIGAQELRDSEQAIANHRARVVFATPERLADPAFIALLSAGETSLLVVDEAHCISQWGHDFRPAFLNIAAAAQALGRPTVLALTATAGDDVAADIMEQLAIPKAGWVDTGTYRSNLHFAVEQSSNEADKLARTRALVRDTQGSGIVYAATVKAAQSVYQALCDDGELAGLYHGKLGAADRREAQDAFMAGKLRVMVATNAFGMGIDKADIRFILHFQMPSGLDAYYQECGRAGRDGAPAACTLLYLRRDKAVQQFFLAGRYPGADELEAIYRTLQEAPPDVDHWNRESLHAHSGVVRNKLQVVLSLLAARRIVRVDRAGHVQLLRRELGADALHGLLRAYREKREQDQATLERMVFYAQSGQCRWQVLLAYLEDEANARRCGACDNCKRIAKHEHAIAAPIAVSTEVALGHPAKLSLPGPIFAEKQAVRVKRYGEGQVVSVDAMSITIEFADGERRCFLPEFVKAVREKAVARTAAVQVTPAGSLRG